MSKGNLFERKYVKKNPKEKKYPGWFQSNRQYIIMKVYIRQYTNNILVNI